MVRYETLFLTIPELTQDEFQAIESAFDKAIRDAKGIQLSCERWGKYKLAYPVQRKDYGIYGLVRFEVDEAVRKDLLDTIRSLLSIKFNDKVMRFMTAKLDINASLAYHRPESLEETPGREAETFLKTGKVDRLLSKTRESAEAASSEQGQADERFSEDEDSE
ncbi:30S ribosomal protein S6 [Candidatus Babeliales bacterium]|nr:30S ribosomal protein S6 [Candidatus Babeliales bacterium]